MDAIELLMSEHRQIEAALDTLEQAASKAADTGTADPAEVARYVRFIRDFADSVHHGKEEAILFKAMIDSGFPVQGGPLAIMLDEHEQGRRYLAQMAAVAALPGPLDAGAATRFAGAALHYAELLRHHIFKEDNILYPMARMHLEPQAMAEVNDRCERFQAARADLSDLLTLARSLAA